METWCEDTLIKLKVSELKEVLKKYKLPIYGIKVVLIQRLLNFKDDSNKLNGQEESQEVNCSASTPMSSQTSFSYSLHRIKHAISDIDGDVSEENSPIIKKTDKKKNGFHLQIVDGTKVCTFVSQNKTMSLAYTWLKENGIINKIDNTNNLIVAKLEYQHLINDFQALINNCNLVFDFDTAANIVGHVFYVTINELNWHYSSYTCSFFSKNIFL
jgi:hypothetical protein